jgi:hypothetical protein
MDKMTIDKSTMPSLFVLADEYREAADKLAQMDLPAEVVRDTLEGLSGELKTKAANVAMFVRSLQATTEKMTEAIANIEARKAVIERRAKEITDWLHTGMVKAGISSIDDNPYLSLKLKKLPGRIEITQPDLVPDEYKTVPPIPEPRPDLRAIKAAIEQEEAAARLAAREPINPVPGATLIKGTRLEIK